MVDDGDNSDVVKAGTLSAVTTAAALHFTNESDSGGSDPSGCTASLTRVRRPNYTEKYRTTPITAACLDTDSSGSQPGSDVTHEPKLL